MQKKLTPVLAILLVVAIVVAGVFGSQKGDLNDKVAALEAELKASKGSVETLTGELAAAKAELDAAAANGAALETNVADLTAQAEVAAADLAAAQAAADAANAELAAAKADLEAAAAEKAALEANVADLTAQAEAAAAELAAAKAELETANAELAAAQAALETANAELEAVKAELAAAQAGLDAAAAKDVEQEAAAAELTARGEASAAELADVHAALESANQGLATAKLDLEASVAKVAELEASVSALSAEEANTEADLAATKAALEAANAELATAKAALESANAELASAKAALEAGHAELEAVKAELAAAQADLAAAQAEIETLKAELEAAKAAAVPAEVPAEEPAPVEEPVAEAPAYDGPTSQAFLMFADGAWVNQVWNAGETPAGMTVTEATITGEGDYTVGLAFETPAEGVAFTALGIADGELNFPGWKIKINEIRVNGQAIEVGKGYTSTDEGIVTRMNIFNEWVGEIPADARSFDGETADASWIIVNKEDFASVESFEVDFSFIKYGIDTAYIMYADANWAQQYWLDGNEYPVAATNAVIKGAGDYTVGLDFTNTEAGKASGVAFAALGIKHGEKLFPGMMIKLNEVRINGEAVDVVKGYTSSDDQIETRMNLMNEWVTELPKDARSWDASLDGASPIVIAKEKLAEVKTIEIDFSLIPVTDTAFIMFASSDWAVSAWNPGEYAETNAVKIEGPGTYTLKMEYDEPLAGYAFLAAGIATGEQTFPGHFMDITEIKINGEAIEIGKDFTTTDEGITTRANIWNEWVTELPAQARIADGNLEGTTAMIAPAEVLSNVSSIEITFDFIYGEPPAAEVAPLTEEELAAMLNAEYHAYVALQSENYIFRNDFEDATYGRDGEQADFFTHLTGWDAENNAIDYGGVFEDATITGNGTYTVTMTTGEMGFGTDSFFRYFRVATDIPARLVKEGHVTITDAKVKIGEGKTQEGLIIHTEGDWLKIVVTDEYNKLDAGFGYTLPGANTPVVFTFTVNGLAK
ncbi:MAG: hypothetical protein E7318_04530 [Clostridiales bacterium]|nr:hypothetical protein [Clostridiales bacterium]